MSKGKKPERKAAQTSNSKPKEIQPHGTCERMDDCVAFLRENTAAVVKSTVKDALNNVRDGRKQFYELTGLKDHFSKEVFQKKPEERAFITTDFERDMLEGLRQLTDEEQGHDESEN